MRVIGVVILLIAAWSCQAQNVYFPEACKDVCKDPEDFIPSLPRHPVDGDPRIKQWTIIALNQIRTNLGTPPPPGVGRALGIFGSCLYEATTLFDNGLKPIAAEKFVKIGVDFPDKLVPAIDGAAYTALEFIFGKYESIEEVRAFFGGFEDSGEYTFLSEFLDFLERGASRFLARILTRTGTFGLSDLIAMEAGSLACEEVIEWYTKDGYDGLGEPYQGTAPYDFEPVNSPQVRAGLTDCPTQMNDLDRWQPVCTPRSLRAQADVGTKQCNVQEWLSPWAGGMTTFAIPRGKPTEGDKLIEAVMPVHPEVIGGPPLIGVGTRYEKEMMEIIESSASLGDPQKLIAEYWADGPDSTAPPGTWFLIAQEAAVAAKLGIMETAQLMALVGNSLNDAGVAAWRIKLTYDSVRPLQMVQCGFGGQGDKMIRAWRGPYQGVGLIRASRWQPYQLDTFKTPPFGGYVSGHSTFSFAASEALRLFFGDDTYLGPNCQLFPEGSSQYEKKIVEGEPDFVAGLTDVPNSGKDKKGYSPSSDVTFCWENYSDAALQASESRLHGGIHVNSHSIDGDAVGLETARANYITMMELFGTDSGDVKSVY